MGEPETSHFYDFGIWDESPAPKTNYFYLWSHQETQRKSGKNLGAFSFFVIIKILKILDFVIFRKDGHRRKLDDPCNKILKTLDMRSISMKNMRWTFGNMDQISLKSIKGFL